jgi:hypothetical protein
MARHRGRLANRCVSPKVKTPADLHARNRVAILCECRENARPLMECRFNRMVDDKDSHFFDHYRGNPL